MKNSLKTLRYLSAALLLTFGLAFASSTFAADEKPAAAPTAAAQKAEAPKAAALKRKPPRLTLRKLKRKPTKHRKLKRRMTLPLAFLSRASMDFSGDWLFSAHWPRSALPASSITG